MTGEILFTKHAEDMLIERKFSKKLIEEVVLEPDFVIEGESDEWSAVKKVDDKMLRVVVSGEEKPYTIVTM